VASVFTPSLGTVHECNSLLLLRLFEWVHLRVVPFGSLYLTVGMYLFVGLLVVLYMNQILVL
jgi:hypothetical protein